MTDERDSADAAADGNDTEVSAQGGRTAVVTRPQRPSGKRSRQRVDADTEPSEAPTEVVEVAADDSAETAEIGAKKRKKTPKSKKTKRPKKSAAPAVNPIVFIYTYLKQVVAELRKVIWPNRKQMMTYTGVVLAFLAFMVTLIGLVDLGLAKLVLLVFG